MRERVLREKETSNKAKERQQHKGREKARKKRNKWLSAICSESHPSEKEVQAQRIECRLPLYELLRTVVACR